nr:MAG TPA: hypothetical protein [Bacteriophage sp.]
MYVTGFKYLSQYLLFRDNIIQKYSIYYMIIYFTLYGYNDIIYMP